MKTFARDQGDMVLLPALPLHSPILASRGASWPGFPHRRGFSRGGRGLCRASPHTPAQQRGQPALPSQAGETLSPRQANVFHQGVFETSSSLPAAAAEGWDRLQHAHSTSGDQMGPESLHARKESGKPDPGLLSLSRIPISNSSTPCPLPNQVLLPPQPPP